MGDLRDIIAKLGIRGDLTQDLTDLGIPITTSDGRYRTLLDILNELSECWDNLTEKQKDHIVQKMIGEEINEE